MKKFLPLLLMLFSTLPVLAQDDYEENGHKLPPYNFIGIQGGVQNTFNSDFNNWKTFTPTATISFGRWFTPVVGARVGLNGAWNRSGVAYLNGPDGHYRYNYITPSADVLVNLCTLFGKKSWYPVNLIFIGGLGANYAFENYYRSEEKAPRSNMLHADNDSRWGFNGRLGLALDVPLCDFLSFNIEADYNGHAIGKKDVFNTDRSQLTLQAGLNFKFGYKKAPKPQPVASIVEEPVQETAAVAEPEPVYRTRIDTIWYDDVTYNETTRDRDIKKEIFFGLKEDGVSQDQAQIKAVADFLKGVKDGEVTITSYADKGTGSPATNMNYSKKRAESTRRALIQHGVNPKMIKKVEWKGDTVQPYPNDNDKNRLSVITGHGVYTDKEKVVTKKFRTKEVRYRVN